ncbi:hypothetical protein E1261_14155 [Kribbella albertanoniae]|uniref:Uncharacterized protein n=1 Tax=Kribbella albertanoniae TaxID=1266829 RepID=A0A4R4Q5F0_9ACTN|nr:hypothetical protein E1261_14155 [Kribbella albertanoniae]
MDGRVRISWQDVGEANTVRVEYPDRPLTQVLEFTEAGAPNEAFANRLVDDNRVRVTVTTKKDGEQSTPTPSAWFDARWATHPVVQDATLLADGSVAMKWTQPAIGVDQTPNDPLDRPLSDEWLKITLTPAKGAKEEFLLPAGATEFTVPPRQRPMTLRMSSGNEWISWIPEGRWVRVGVMSAGMSVPALESYGRYLDIMSTLDLFYCDCAEHGESGITVQLQARANSSAPWKTYGRFGADTVDPVQTPMSSLGGRQYRLWVPAQKAHNGDITLSAATSTAAKSSRTVANMIITRFEPSRLLVGQTTKLNVRVQPAIDMTAALQSWNGKQWRYVRAVPLKKGIAIVPIKATRRGTTTFRIATPPVTVSGLPVLATTSKPFTLTIR